MKDAVQLECWHDTAKKLMYHVVGNRVTIITNKTAGVIKFYKDGKKYGEMSAHISVAEFEGVIDRTIQDLEKFEQQFENKKKQ